MLRIEKDEFNSTIFQMKMGNIIEFSKNDKAELDKETGNYDHLSIKLDCSELELCNYLLSKGFYIVDTLVSYVFDYEKNKIPEISYNQDIQINDVEREDISLISDIAYHSFFNDRFHNDPYLDKEKCNEYYETWIRNSCNGFADMVLVGKDRENHILGFGTGKYYDENHSALVLNAVTEYARGKGVYTAMIFEAMKRFKGKSRHLTLGTQINNYAVQKAWNKLGFKIYESKYVLHKRIVK